MNTYDIFINGKFFGNVSAKNLIDAEMFSRQLIKMSNPTILASKFSLLQRVSEVEFDL